MLVICLAQVLLSSILLFVYFKTRIGKVEEKLDIMFHLVQSHTQQQNSMDIYENTQSIGKTNNDMNTDNNDINDEINNELNSTLIHVSDDSDTDTDDDSDDDTDDDEEKGDEELVIGGNIKKISLNLDDEEDTDDFPFILEKKGDFEEEVNNLELLEEVSVVENCVNDDVVDDVVDVVDDFENYRVVDLKKMCEERELTNYKKLKKNELIELLKKN